MSNAVLVADVVVSNNDRSRLTLSSNTIVASSVPEPGTLGLLGAGMVGLVGMIHRKVRKPA
jgi:hypothetical protein